MPTIFSFSIQVLAETGLSSHTCCLTWALSGPQTDSPTHMLPVGEIESPKEKQAAPWNEGRGEEQAESRVSIAWSMSLAGLRRLFPKKRWGRILDHLFFMHPQSLIKDSSQAQECWARQAGKWGAQARFRLPVFFPFFITCCQHGLSSYVASSSLSFLIIKWE